VPPATLEFVHTRVGQINGMQRVRRHALSPAREARREPPADLRAPPTKREAPYTDAERAALALAEASTRPSDRADAVPDEVWREASRHFSEAALGALVMSIALANLWNRLNVATRQVTGDWMAQYL
jgi:alkylhydroperoxidase family enzyme